METEIIQTRPGDAGFHLFESLPQRLYEAGSLRHKQTDSLNLEFLDRCFVLTAGGIPQARVALYNNPNLHYNGMKAACAGNYECVADEQLARQLLDFTVLEARKNGADFLVGPMNGSTWDNYRFSLNHSNPNFLLEPYHHLYYNDHFKHAGFEAIAHYISGRDTALECDHPDVVQREAQLLAAGLKIRNIDLHDFEGELEKLYPFIARTFSGNLLYTPVSWETFRDKYLQAAPIIDPDFVLIAEDGAQHPVGFIFCYNDLYNPQEKSLVIKTIARDSDAKWTGLGQVLGNRIIRLLNERHYDSLIHAFMIEDGVSTFASRKFHGEHYKNYALYGKKI